MSKHRYEGKLVFGPPLVIAIACDLIGSLLLVAGLILDADRGQKILACAVGAAILTASSALLLWQLLKRARRVPNDRWQ